jgi:hypothetical protein
MNKFAVFALALSPALILAQDAESSRPSPSGLITKVIRVRYANAENIATTVPPARSLFIRGNNGLRVVVVAGEPKDVASVVETVKELDVPSISDVARDVEMRVYVIGAGPKAQTPAVAASDIEPVIKQLEAAFHYASYQLLDTMLLRSREGETAKTDGMMKSFPTVQEQHANRYAIEYHLLNEPGDTHRTIRLDRFEFRTHTSTAASNAETLNVGLQTNLEVHEGEKIVVGKTNIDDGDSALFVVLTAKIVE